MELLKKTYGATIKKLSVSDSDAYSRTTQANGMFAQNDAWWSSWHLLPLLGAFESDNAYYLIEPALQFTLHDMLTFSPVIMSNSIAKFLFVIYQLIHIFLTFSAKGFTISPSLNFKNLFVTDSLWLLTSGLRIDANDVQLDRDTPNISLTNETLFKTPLLLEPPLVCKENLLDYTVQWVNGQISNFDYLIILNCLAGRRVCDPSYHPVFPWIMDFSKPDDCFRDLSKSKYRLCKGDMQLDFTYSSETRSHSRKDKVFDEHAPHHIPDDPLTSITYYVYLARRIPKDVLCTHVRTKWVPEEYPASMERLYHWTPEECIPEFFTDPGIFQSIHSDLADLQLPSWADSAEAFVAHHRKILEGPHVSRNLHSWIDLIFGHMLSGTSAVGAKNIYLSLVDNHSHAVNHGVIQLFPKPHPKRKVIHTSDAAPAASNASSLTASTTVTRNENFVEEQTDNAQDGGMFDYFNNEVQGIDVEDSVKRKVSGTLRRDFMSVDSAVDLIEGKDDLEPYLKEAGAEPSVPLLPTILKQKLDILLETSSVDSKESSEDSLIKLPKGMNMIEDLERIEKLLKFEASVCPPDEFGVGEHKFGSIFDGIDEDVSNTQLVY